MAFTETEAYAIKNHEEIFSPSLIVFKERLLHNLNEMIQIAGGPDRLRPHCKTHKIREIIEIEKSLGIKKHKCATIAEAEMLGEAGVDDVLLAYQMVGPNIARMLKLVDTYPDTRFGCLVDHPKSVDMLSFAAQSLDGNLYVMLDLNPGMNRTGIEVGENALDLYEMISIDENLQIGGLHWYDGHHRQPDPDVRTGLVNAAWSQLIQFRDQLLLNGFDVPRIVTAGTGSFPILARHGEPNLELGPGTTVFHDDDMATRFPEMPFVPAAGILTRVVSKNRPGELTLDVGHKACAADQPFGNRLKFPSLPDAEEILHSEEHLVIRTNQAGQFSLGDALVAIPRHACPVSAVHQCAHIIEGGEFTERWQVAARNRFISI